MLIKLLTTLAAPRTNTTTTANLLKLSDDELRKLADRSPTLASTAQNILNCRKRHDSPAAW